MEKQLLLSECNFLEFISSSIDFNQLKSIFTDIKVNF
jgi:hypothetical protein